MIRLRLSVPLLALVLVSACAGNRLSLPDGPGTAFPGFEAVYAEATARCAGARTVGADLGLSGRAGGSRLRGTVQTAVGEGGAIRLEGIALGRAIFILAGRNGRATLLLTREGRVVRDEPAEQIIEALAGVRLTPDDLRAAVAGCGLSTGAPSNGRMFNNDWAAVDVGESVTYLRRVDGQWRVGGASRTPVTLTYEGYTGDLPSAIALRSGSADIRLRVSGLDINTPIDPRAFVIEIPADAEPLSLEELRRAGPMGERR